MPELQDDYLDFLQAAEYDGAFFYAERATTRGGRKTVVHGFVNSDRQLVEDLGLNPDSFTLSGTVAAIPKGVGRGGAKTYPQAKATLLAKLRAGGRGVLVHPFTGRLENIVALDWTLDEDVKRAGRATISIRFALSDTDGVPKETASVIETVEGDGEKVEEEARLNVVDNFFAGVERLADGGLKQVGRFTQTFEDGVAKVNDFVAKVEAATDPLTKLADEIDGFAAELGKITNSVFSLVDNPAALSDSLFGVMNSVNNLFATPEAAFDAFSNLFQFGDDDVPTSAPTAAAIQRQQNRDVINAAVLSSSLSFAYLNASLVDFETTEQIDLAAETLEAQFQKVVDGGSLNLETENALAQMRTTTKKFFDDAKTTRPDVVDFLTHATAARVLSFAHYGTSEFGDTIVGLNRLRDPANVPAGTVKILSTS